MMVIWITGLSGAGKTTLAKELVATLGRQGHPTVLLDGDEIREAIADPYVSHDRASRLANAYRISRLAKTFEAQELVVVVATMSLFHEIHDWNRSSLRFYLEVFLKADLEVLKKRDAKGLYGRAAKGKQNNVVGHDLDVEEPQSADIVLSTEFTQDALEKSVQTIMSALSKRDGSGA